jgi:hypothetical protein
MYKVKLNHTTKTYSGGSAGGELLLLTNCISEFEELV